MKLYTHTLWTLKLHQSPKHLSKATCTTVSRSVLSWWGLADTTMSYYFFMQTSVSSGRQTFVTLKNAIHPQCCCSKPAAVSLFHTQGQQITITASAYQWQQRKSKELDRVDWKTEAWGSGVQGVSRVESMPCNTKGAKAKRQAEWSENTPIAKSLCHPILVLGKGYNASLTSANSLKFETLQSLTTPYVCAMCEVYALHTYT